MVSSLNKRKFWAKVSKNQIPGVKKTASSKFKGRKSGSKNVPGSGSGALGKRVRISSKRKKKTSKGVPSTSDANVKSPELRNEAELKEKKRKKYSTGNSEAAAILDRQRALRLEKKMALEELEANTELPISKRRKMMKDLRTDMRDAQYSDRKALNSMYGNILSFANDKDKKTEMESEIDKIINMCRGEGKDFATETSCAPTKSFVSRSLQLCLKYGTENQKKGLVNSLMNLGDRDFIELLMGKYSHQLVIKLYLYAQKEARFNLLNRMLSTKPLATLSSRFGAQVWNYVFNKRDGPIRSRIMNSLFLPDFVNSDSKLATVRSWEKIFIQLSIPQRKQCIEHVFGLLDKLVSHELLIFEMSHTMLKMFVSVLLNSEIKTEDDSKSDVHILRLSETINEGCHDLIPSQDGVFVLCCCLGYWSAKQKKTFLKQTVSSMGPDVSWVDYAANAVDSPLVMRILDTVDDSQLCKKVVEGFTGWKLDQAEEEWVATKLVKGNNMHMLLQSENGCKLLRWMLTGEFVKGASVEKSLLGIKKLLSKKDAEIKKQELKGMAQAVLQKFFGQLLSEDCIPEPEEINEDENNSEDESENENKNKNENGDEDNENESDQDNDEDEFIEDDIVNEDLNEDKIEVSRPLSDMRSLMGKSAVVEFTNFENVFEIMKIKHSRILLEDFLITTESDILDIILNLVEKDLEENESPIISDQEAHRFFVRICSAEDGARKVWNSLKDTDRHLELLQSSAIFIYVTLAKSTDSSVCVEVKKILKKFSAKARSVAISKESDNQLPKYLQTAFQLLDHFLN